MGILNQTRSAISMGLTVPVARRIKTSANISAVSSGIQLGFAQSDGLLSIDGKEHSLSEITSLSELQNGDLLVGCSDGLHCFSNAEELWGIAIETGVESIVGNVMVDGLGTAHLIRKNGELSPLDAQSVLFISIGPSIAIATEAGVVSTYSLDGLKTWSRPVRGTVGERITALGWSDDTLVIAREGHGLVPGEEEALEVEYWVDGQLKNRFDTKGRVISIDGFWMGLDMGGVMLGQDIICELQHPANILIDRGEHCLVGSWFHLHKISNKGIEWAVETKGMVEYISSNSAGDVVLVAGSDQNDYSDPEPVVVVDSNSEPIDKVDETSSIADWGEAPAIEIDASELYGSESSYEDLAGFAPTQPTVRGDALMDALNDDIEPVIQSTQDEDDLMLSLSLDIAEIIAPSPDAGGDQQVRAGEDGSAIVTLDGTGTRDPQSRIELWSWVDQSGKEIGNADRLRVKLMRGHHRFELRIRDIEGRWSSDSIDVKVE